MPKLRPFQREDVDKIKKSGLRALVASAPGTGKTAVAIASVLETGRTSLPALVICPSSVMHNWEKEFRMWAPGLRTHIVDDMSSPVPPDIDVYITSWALLDPRLTDFHRKACRTVVADECFPAGTKILTKKGQMPIEEVQTEDEVWAEDVSSGDRHWAKVVATQKKTTVEKLVRVRHEHGEFTCTANHKIWTVEGGYICAERIRGHHLRVLPEICKKGVDELREAPVLQPCLLGSVPEHDRGGEDDAQEGRGCCAETVSGFRSVPERHTRDTESGISAHVREESDVARENETAGEPNSSTATASSPGTGRERSSALCSSADATRPNAGIGARAVLWREPFPEEGAAAHGEQLRGRCGACPHQNSDRDRWDGAQCGALQGSRCAEGQASLVSRVESVEVQEREASSRPGERSLGNTGSDLESVVYDIEVERLHNYFAEGVLVSNCHLAKNPEALRSQALYQLTRGKGKGILLLSGTPIINTTDEMAVLHSLFEKTPLMVRRLLEDVAPDVPPKFRSYLYINMRDRDQADYDRAVDDFEEWLLREKRKLLDTGAAQDAVDRALAAEAFVKVGYLRRLVGEAKTHAAADWATRAVRIGEPVVLFVEHQNALLRLEKALRGQRVRYGVIEGKTLPKVRHQLVQDFQDNKFPVLICTKAGKEGITLHAARHLLFVERFFTSAEEEQMEDRIRRIGQLYPTTIWFLHAAGTIDDRLDTIVRSKRIIIRDAIGAADVAETAESNVAALIKTWDSFVREKREVVDLGRGAPLPPLPSPSDTHAVVFYGERWKTRSAARWCRMHGYLPSSRVDLVGRFKLVVHPIDVFKPEKFTAVPVCEDIRVIKGKRLSAENEAVVRQRLRRIQG